MPTTKPLPPVPAFARPHITCGSAPERAMSHHCIRTVRPLREWCGGCGTNHERVEYEDTGLHDHPFDALRAAGLQSGHVGVLYVRDSGEAYYVCAGRCCRDANESAEWIAARRKLDATARTQYSVVQTPEEAADDAAAEEWSERMYASSYGLGL